MQVASCSDAQSRRARPVGGTARVALQFVPGPVRILHRRDRPLVIVSAEKTSRQQETEEGEGRKKTNGMKEKRLMFMLMLMSMLMSMPMT